MFKHEVISAKHADIRVASINLNKKGSCMLLCPGWGESIEILKYSMNELKRLNRPLVVLEHPRQFKPVDNPLDVHNNQYQKAHNIISVIKHFNLSQIDLISHSEGSMNGLVAASINPEIFRSVTLLNPSGIVRFRSRAHFLMTLCRKVAVDAKRVRKMPQHGEIFKLHTKMGKKHGVVNTKQLREDLSSATKFSILGLISSLVKSNIFISVVAAKDDVLYPANSIKQRLETNQINKYVETEGWHDEMHYNPEKYAQIINEILTEIDGN